MYLLAYAEALKASDGLLFMTLGFVNVFDLQSGLKLRYKQHSMYMARGYVVPSVDANQSWALLLLLYQCYSCSDIGVSQN